MSVIERTARYTFPRQRRLNESGDFRRVFAKSISAASSNFTLLARRNPEGVPRLGLAVAKKHLKRAHHRNRVKRIIRESFRRNQHILSDIDVVVLIKRGIAIEDRKQLAQDIDLLWLKLSKRCEKSLHT